MLVVCDASPINLLVRIELIHILPALFGKVVIPSAVAEELSRPSTPEVVRAWLIGNPSWIDVRAPSSPAPAIPTRHRGEREAISLARELNADLFLVDDRRARLAAHQFGIETIGTIGLLERAAEAELVDLEQAFEKVRHTDFYVSDDLLDETLRRHSKRRKSSGE